MINEAKDSAFASEGPDSRRAMSNTLIYELIQLYLLSEDFDRAIFSAENVETAQGYYLMSYACFKQKKYFDAFIFIGKAIDNLLDNQKQEVLSALNRYKMGLSDLYVFSSTVNQIINNTEGVCDDLLSALMMVPYGDPRVTKDLIFETVDNRGCGDVVYNSWYFQNMKK